MSQFRVILAPILLFFPVLRRPPQETGQVIHRGRHVHWGSTSRHYQAAWLEQSVKCLISADMRWMNTLPTATLGRELDTAAHSVKKMD